MIIDFHTHIFPEKIADRALQGLRKAIETQTGEMGVTFADGTYDGLKNAMVQDHVDLSVVLPVCTKPSQIQSVLDYAEHLNSLEENNLEHFGKSKEYAPKVLSFAGIFPGQEHWKDYLREIKDRGFKGIKIHPEYQQVYIDSPEGIALFKECEALELYCTYHAGNDIGIAPPVHSTPEQMSHVLQEVSGKYIIAAHLGGWKSWDEVEEYLVGTNVYLDTAFVCNYIKPEQYERIIKTHGADKILFATDSPWELPGRTLEGLQALHLTEEEMNLILSGNAMRILGL